MTNVFTCPRCQTKSLDPGDFKRGYCAQCRDHTAIVESSEWTQDEWERALREFPHEFDAGYAEDPEFTRAKLTHVMAEVFRWRQASAKVVTYLDEMDFTCPRCFGKTSHPDAHKHGYCGICGEYTASVPPPQWTDAEWLRVLAEFPPNASIAHVAATVFQWRRTQSTPDSPPSTPDGGQ